MSWQTSPKMKTFSSIVFPMHTLMEISEEDFGLLTSDTSDAAPLISTPEAVEDRTAFVLEKYLEDFIVNNFDTIFKKKLKLYSDGDGNEGQQYATEVGIIDILATESVSDSFVVIELKKGRPSDQVIGQTLRYMGWVKKNLCKNGQSVSGLIICKDSDPKLTYALEMATGIDLKYYSISFKLSEQPTVEQKGIA
jgi:restriction system protein